MIREQINIAGLALDNMLRRKKIYFLLICSIAIGTGIIVFLIVTVSGMNTTVQNNLMLLPLRKLWVRSGTSEGEYKPITEGLLKSLKKDKRTKELYPQVNYNRSSYLELIIRVMGVYRERFSSIVEVYGIKPGQIREDLFKGAVFNSEDYEKVPVIFPESVVNMINRNISQKVFKEGRTFPVSVIKNFEAELFLSEKKATSRNRGYRKIECVPVGVSLNIPQIGVGVPIELVNKWNREIAGEDSGTTYARVLIEAEDPETASELGKELEDKGYVVESGRKTYETVSKIFDGIKAGVAIFGILLIFALSTALFNGLSLVVFSEKDVIGVMRAVGAKNSAISEILLLQAVATGFTGGVIGTAVCLAITTGIEPSILSIIHQNGFKADDFFTFSPALLLAGVILPALICVVFGLLASLRAVTLNPAEILKS